MGTSQMSRWRLVAMLGATAVTVLLASAADAGGGRPGSLVRSFGDGGRVETPATGGNMFIAGVAAQQGGMVIAGGHVGRDVDAGGALTALRYTRTGRLDARYGVRGRARARFSVPVFASAVLVQPDAKAIVVGSPVRDGRDLGFAAARFTVTGALDRSFGREGMVMTGLSPGLGAAFDAALQPDGKLVVVGRFLGAEAMSGQGGSDIAVARYTATGDLDPAFGDGGVVRLDTGHATESAIGVAVRPNGKIVLLGTVPPPGGRGETLTLLTQLEPDGNRDETFGSLGLIRSSATVSDLALARNGEVMVSGDVQLGSTRSGFLLALFTRAGRPFRDYGRNGSVVTDFGPRESVSAPAIALDRRGWAILAGGWSRRGSAERRFAVARYRPNGRLDELFSSDGRVVTAFRGRRAVARDVAIVGRRRDLVASGSATARLRRPKDRAAFLARYAGRHF